MFNSSRSKDRREGLDIIKDITRNKSGIFSIYCSYESFINSKSSIPRVTSISIYNLATAETKTFWLHQEAEHKGYTSRRLTLEQLNAAERSMIERFFRFAKKHQSYVWIHWDMNDSIYGFEALNSRIKLLGGKPLTATVIMSHYKCDLLILLSKLYGPNFESEEMGNRVIGLVKRNKITNDSILTREQEAEAYFKKEHQTIVMSSQNNAKAIGLIFGLASSKKLIVAAKASEASGLTLLEMALLIGDNLKNFKRIASAVSGFLSFAIFLWNFESLKSTFKLITNFFFG